MERKKERISERLESVVSKRFCKISWNNRKQRRKECLKREYKSNSKEVNSVRSKRMWMTVVIVALAKVLRFRVTGDNLLKVVALITD